MTTSHHVPETITISLAASEPANAHHQGQRRRQSEDPGNPAHTGSPLPAMPVLSGEVVCSRQRLAHVFKLLPGKLTQRETAFKNFKRQFLNTSAAQMGILMLVIGMAHQMH
jgi:hypothetical protein